MAWTSANLSSFEIAKAALDKPMVIVNAIPISPTRVKWVEHAQVGANTIDTWTDRTATTSPARFGYDGFVGFVTKPASNSPIFYYCFDFGVSVEFDSVLCIGGNWGDTSLAGAGGMCVQIADDNAFSANLTTIAEFGNPATNDRLCTLTPNHGGAAQRYSARYLWVKFDNGVGGADILPEIGELILGSRTQLEYQPDRPYDDYALRENAEITETSGGTLYKQLYARRGFSLSGQLLIAEDSRLDDARDFFRSCRGSFVWIPKPNSAPDSWYAMMREGGLEMPERRHGLRTWGISAAEQGPEEYYLDVEENG